MDAEAASVAPESAADHVLGVYSSPSEIGGFSGTVLVIERGLSGDLGYWKTHYTDVVSPNDIEQDIQAGSVLVEGDHVYIPEAYGYYRDGVPRLQTSINRCTLVKINGHQTLMRDDAYNVYQQENRLYDYGILFKVSDDLPRLHEIDEVEHKSIKVLYDDRSKAWEDSYVQGPNER